MLQWHKGKLANAAVNPEKRLKIQASSAPTPIA